MVFLLKNVLLRLLCENFVREGVRCDASNRLLRNSSRDRPDDGIRVPAFISMVGRGVMTFSQRIHVVSTGSHPKIPP